MTGAANFILSLCACALVFSIIVSLLPEAKISGAVKTAAAVFMLAVILKSAALLIKDLQSDLANRNTERESISYSEEEYISDQAELAVKEVVTSRLREQKCEFSDIAVKAVYAKGGFENIEVFLTVPKGEEKKAEQILKDMEISYSITVLSGE